MAVVYREFNGDMAGEPPILQGPEDAVVINEDENEYLPETTTDNTLLIPKPTFIDKYGIYLVIGFVLLAMILMYVFRKKIA